MEPYYLTSALCSQSDLCEFLIAIFDANNLWKNKSIADLVAIS